MDKSIPDQVINVVFSILAIVSLAVGVIFLSGSILEIDNFPASKEGTPVASDKVWGNKMTSEEFESKIDSKIVSVFGEDLESAFVQYPDFLNEKRTMKLGAIDSVVEGSPLVVSTLNQVYLDSRIAVYGEFRDRMTNEQALEVISRTVILSIDHGEFSLLRDSDKL